MLSKLVLIHSEGALLVGVVSGEDIADLYNASARIKLKDPMLLSLVPTGQKTIQMHLSGASVIRSKDERFLVTPTIIEILGDVVTGTDGVVSCSDASEFFSAYNDALIAKRVAQAGIIVPNGQDLSGMKSAMMKGKR